MMPSQPCDIMNVWCNRNQEVYTSLLELLNLEHPLPHLSAPTEWPFFVVKHHEGHDLGPTGGEPGSLHPFPSLSPGDQLEHDSESPQSLPLWSRQQGSSPVPSLWPSQIDTSSRGSWAWSKTFCYTRICHRQIYCIQWVERSKRLMKDTCCPE